MNYKETEKYIKEIHHSDELLFRMAISHLMDVGIGHLTDENVTATCDKIMKQDDSKSLLSNEMQCEIVKTAAKLAAINHIHLLVYISKYVKYGVI